MNTPHALSPFRYLPTAHLAVVGMSLTLLTACFANQPIAPRPDLEPTEMTRTSSKAAKAELKKADGTHVGDVQFESTGDGVRIKATLTGLSPNSVHGFHVHEGSECKAPDFASAGGHFAPDGNEHGPMGRGSHAGDLGNLTADDDGMAMLDIMAHDLRLEGEDSALNHAVVLHAERDDLASQPSGDAGPRLACGEVREVRAAITDE